MIARTRVPMNSFGLPFGLAGLGGCWLSLARYNHAPEAIGDTLLVLAALAWATVIVLLARSCGWAVQRIGSEFGDPVGGPFGSLAVIIPMLLSSWGVYPHAPVAGKSLVDVFLALTVILGAWYTGQWIYRPLDVDSLHPGYFLPTVAGGLVAAASAASVGQQQLAEALFGLGIVCWLVLGSIVLGRLLVRPMLPTPLVPTLAIEVAPAAVASLAWFAMNGDRLDTTARVLAGYGVLMAVAQIRLLPAYLRLPLMPSTWAFTFSWAAVVTAGLHWLQLGRPIGFRVYEYLVTGIISACIVWLVVRTVVAIRRGTYVARPSTSPTHLPVEPEDSAHVHA